MKITDTQLSTLISLEKQLGDNGLLSDVKLSAYQELQQHRAAAHERRWRKISEEGLPPTFSACSFTDGENTHLFKSWTGDQRQAGITLNCPTPCTHWRPAETDLPEG